MRKWLLLPALVGLALALNMVQRVVADYNATQGTGTIFRAFDTGNGGSALCAAANTQCQAVGLIDSAGAEKGTAGNPLTVTGIGVADNTAFVAQTNSIVAGYAETTPSALTTGRTGMFGVVPATRAMRVRLTNATGDQIGDPCSYGTKLFKNISQTTSTELFTGTASNRTYICHVFIMANAAETISLISGTGTVCATSPGPLTGGGSATPLSAISANGGYSLGNGAAAIAKSDTDADNICLVQAGAVQLTGVLSYVVAPN